MCVGAWAVPVGFQAGGVRHDMCDIVLLFHSVEQVSHWAFGVDGHILAAVRLCIQWDGGLLHVLVINWAEMGRWFYIEYAVIYWIVGLHIVPRILQGI